MGLSGKHLLVLQIVFNHQVELKQDTKAAADQMDYKGVEKNSVYCLFARSS